MIVTCPSCASKYRVRDESVPVDGAELQCPTCGAVFVAHPPKPDVSAVTAALEKMARARDTGEQRLQELERAVARADEDAIQLARVREETARAEERAAAAEAITRRLNDELAKARAAAEDHSELLTLKQSLLEAQRKQKTTAADLEVANTLVASLQAEITLLKAGNSPAPSQAFKKAEARIEMPAEAMSLIAAVGPMLWGLEQSISYLEQFAGSEATLAAHVRQLQLLQKVLARLAQSC